MRRVYSGIAAALGCLVAAPVCLADWPQFLGMDSDGVTSKVEGLPRTWPAGGPKKLWEIKVGRGYGGPAICGDSVLLVDRDRAKGDVIRRINLSDGKDVWQFVCGKPGGLSHDGSRSTPATDGKLVFCIGAFGHIHALNVSDGKVAWTAHLLDDWDGKLPRWGVATSPLLMGDLVIVTPWGRKAAVVAYQKATGEVAWTTPAPKATIRMPQRRRRGRKGRRPSGPQPVVLDYSSPVPMRLGDTMTIVASGKTGYTIGVDAKTGKELWSYGKYTCGIHIPSPLVFDDGRVFITGGYGAGSVMIKVEPSGDGYKVEELWRASPKMASTLAQPVLHNGYIYMNNGYKRSEFGMGCVSLDGETKWRTDRSPSFDMGTVMQLGDVILMIDGAGGDLVMVDPQPEGYKELARTPMLKGPEAWAPMAYSNGKLVLRDHSKMICLALK